VFVGTAFLVAMVSSLAGGAVLESAMGTNGARLAAGDASGLALGVVLEMVNVIAVIAIAVGLYPLFRVAWDAVALGYVAVRVLESAFLALAALLPLVAATSTSAGGMESGPAAAPQGAVLQLLAFRSEILGVMIPAFFAVGAVLLYVWLWTTELVPRFVSAWGLVGVVGIVLANVMDVGTPVLMALALPIIANEIFLGVWLIVRGFATGRRPTIPNARRRTAAP
jgi:hypothetical protein